MQTRNEDILKLITPLVIAVATEDKKGTAQSYSALENFYKAALEAGKDGKHLKDQIYRVLKDEISLVVYKLGRCTRAWTLWPKSFRDAVERVDFGRVEDIIQTLRRCINEFNKKGENAYFFMEKDFSLQEFLDRSLEDDSLGVSAIIMAVRAAASENTNKDLKNTKKLCDMIATLTKHGASINVKTELGNVLAEHAKNSFPADDLLTFLLKQEALNVNDGYPITEFVKRGKCRAIKELLEKKAEYKKLPPDKQNILHVAASTSSPEIDMCDTIQFIASQDPSLLSDADTRGRTPLATAVEYRVVANVECLLKLHHEHKIAIDDGVKKYCLRELCLAAARNDAKAPDIEKLSQIYGLFLNALGRDAVDSMMKETLATIDQSFHERILDVLQKNNMPTSTSKRAP